MYFRGSGLGTEACRNVSRARGWTMLGCNKSHSTLGSAQDSRAEGRTGSTEGRSLGISKQQEVRGACPHWERMTEKQLEAQKALGQGG